MLLRQRLLAHHADPGRTQLKVPPTQPLARTWADAARLTAVYSLSVRLGLSRKAAGGRKLPDCRRDNARSRRPYSKSHRSLKVPTIRNPLGGSEAAEGGRLRPA